MFILLLVVSLAVAVSVAVAVSRFFAAPVRGILAHIVVEDISYAWSKYLRFAILVVGISSGVRIWELERYITPLDPVRAEPMRAEVLTLTLDRWILEIYRTIIGSLQGIAWLLLVFFVFALIAYVIVRVGESRSKGRE
jgi:hypothetical protein